MLVTDLTFNKRLMCEYLTFQFNQNYNICYKMLAGLSKNISVATKTEIDMHKSFWDDSTNIPSYTKTVPAEIIFNMYKYLQYWTSVNIKLQKLSARYKYLQHVLTL